MYFLDQRRNWQEALQKYERPAKLDFLSTLKMVSLGFDVHMSCLLYELPTFIASTAHLQEC